MFSWNLPGLGDCATDVTASLQTDYVFAGSTLRYSAIVDPSAIIQFGKDYKGRVQQQVQARGYRNVSVALETKIIGNEGQLTVQVSVPVDQGSSRDVKANIDGAVGVAGLRVVGGSNIEFVSRPSVSEICSGAAERGAKQQPGAGTAPPPGAPDCDFLCQIGKTLGSGSMTTYALIAAAAVAVIFVMGRR